MLLLAHYNQLFIRCKSLRLVRSSVFLASLLFLLISVIPPQVSAWWNGSWTYRKQLTFDNSSQAENLSNFPVMVKLTSSNFDFSKAQSGGQDIRFVDSNDSTQLSYEIEKWDASAQEAYIWVKVPQVDASSNTDYIYMYYGSSSATDAQSASDVWDANYVGVWHLKESGNGTANEFTDSTSNNKDGQGGYIDTSEPPTLTSSGQINGAQDFDGTNDNINFGNNFSFERTDSFTIEAWAKPDTLKSGAVFAKQIAGTVATGYQLRLDVTGAYAFFLNNSVSGGNYIKVTTGDTVTTGTFKQIAVTYNGSSLASGINMYINDSPQTLTVSRDTLSSSIANGVVARAGATSGPANPFDGVLDEIRISNTVRSAGWIAAGYKSSSDTFITFGTQTTGTSTTNSSTTDSSSSSTSPALPPGCGDTAPSSAPDLFQANATHNTVKLYFSPSGNPHNYYYLAYGYSENDERFGAKLDIGNINGVADYTVNYLSPNTTYYFKIRGGNGCAPGQWSKVLKVHTDSYEKKTEVIYYSYYDLIRRISKSLSLL